MQELRLTWEPVSELDSDLVSAQVMKYMDGQAAFVQFPNDTCLMLQPLVNLKEAIEEYHRKARYITEFKVYPMHDGDYLVFFASPLLVYVGKHEFLDKKLQIIEKVAELKFPSEFIVPISDEQDNINMLVGLYARGKLQRDAWSKAEYKFVKSEFDTRFEGVTLD